MTPAAPLPASPVIAPPTPVPDAATAPALEPVTKPWWQSRAIIGALVIVAAQGLRLTGLEINTEALTDAIVSALTLLGAALAWWGRVQASQPISRRVAPGVGSDDPLRLPGGLRPSGVPTQLPPAQPRDPRGHFGD